MTTGKQGLNKWAAIVAMTVASRFIVPPFDLLGSAGPPRLAGVASNTTGCPEVTQAISLRHKWLGDTHDPSLEPPPPAAPGVACPALVAYDNHTALVAYGSRAPWLPEAPGPAPPGPVAYDNHTASARGGVCPARAPSSPGVEPRPRGPPVPELKRPEAPSSPGVEPLPRGPPVPELKRSKAPRKPKASSRARSLAAGLPLRRKASIHAERGCGGGGEEDRYDLNDLLRIAWIVVRKALRGLWAWLISVRHEASLYFLGGDALESCPYVFTSLNVLVANLSFVTGVWGITYFQKQKIHMVAAQVLFNVALLAASIVTAPAWTSACAAGPLAAYWVVRVLWRAMRGREHRFPPMVAMRRDLTLDTSFNRVLGIKIWFQGILFVAILSVWGWHRGIASRRGGGDGACWLSGCLSLLVSFVLAACSFVVTLSLVLERSVDMSVQEFLEWARDGAVDAGRWVRDSGARLVKGVVPPQPPPGAGGTAGGDSQAQGGGAAAPA